MIYITYLDWGEHSINLTKEQNGKDNESGSEVDREVRVLEEDPTKLGHHSTSLKTTLLLKTEPWSEKDPSQHKQTNKQTWNPSMILKWLSLSKCFSANISSYITTVKILINVSIGKNNWFKNNLENYFLERCSETFYDFPYSHTRTLLTKYGNLFQNLEFIHMNIIEHLMHLVSAMIVYNGPAR